MKTKKILMVALLLGILFVILNPDSIKAELPSDVELDYGDDYKFTVEDPCTLTYDLSELGSDRADISFYVYVKKNKDYLFLNNNSEYTESINLVPGEYHVSFGYYDGSDVHEDEYVDVYFSECNTNLFHYTCEYNEINEKIVLSNWFPNNASFSSSNLSIATVDSNGTIKLKKAGKVIITAQYSDKIIEFTIKCNKPTFSNGKNIEKITIIPKASYNLYYDLNNVNYQKVKWKSSNTSVATVKNGIVKAKKNGKTTITAKMNGYTLKCTVQVVSNEYKRKANLDTRDYDKYGAYVQNTKLSYIKDGGLDYTAYLINTYPYTLNFEWIRVQIYCNNVLIAKQKFYNIENAVDYYDYSKFHFIFDKKNVRKKNVDLRNGDITVQWYWEYKK